MMKTRIGMQILGVAALVLLGLPRVDTAQAAVEVNTCGQIVDGDEGFLTGDLDCTGQPVAVRVRNGTLDLRGFTITGSAVSCFGFQHCEIFSQPPGGTITGSAAHGVTCDWVLRVEDVIIRGNADLGVSCNGLTKVYRSTIDLNGAGGIEAARLRIFDSTVSSNGGDGLVGAEHVQRCTVQDNAGMGVWSRGFIKVKSSTVSGNGSDGIHVFSPSYASVVNRVRVLHSTVTNNLGHGITFSDPPPNNNIVVATVVGSTVTGNGLMGAQSQNRLVVRTSIITGNGTDPSCGVTTPCADIASLAPPRFKLVPGVNQCDRSYVLESGLPGADWGVCALD